MPVSIGEKHINFNAEKQLYLWINFKTVAAISAKNSFQAIALEWLKKRSVRWTAAYKKHILRRMEKYVFPAIGKRPAKSVTAPELLEALRRAEDKGADFMAHMALN